MKGYGAGGGGWGPGPWVGGTRRGHRRRTLSFVFWWWFLKLLLFFPFRGLSFFFAFLMLEPLCKGVRTLKKVTFFMGFFDHQK